VANVASRMWRWRGRAERWRGGVKQAAWQDGEDVEEASQRGHRVQRISMNINAHGKISKARGAAA